MFLFCLVFAMFCARLFICASWSPAGKGLTSWLSFVVSSVSLSLSHWYPGSYLIESIPDLCNLIFATLLTFTINKKSTTTEPLPQSGQQPKPPGGLNAFYWYQIFALDSAVVEVQEMFSSYGGHLTNAMYHHGETL